MYAYTISQWVIFFAWYCFVGWIWECCYVSIVQGIKTKKWRFINRGFLNGPFLPIYGTAAVTILLATIPVKEYTWMVYIAGAVAATLMELVTGTAMERLFKVKYWDYSELPLNYNGHICFFVSLFWGLCAIFMTEVIHVPVERILFVIPEGITEIVAVVVVGYFTYDFSISFREAMDMREVLERLTENNESLRRLERRFDAVVAFTAIPDPDDIIEKGRNAKERLESRIERSKERSVEKIRRIKEYLALPEGLALPDREELVSQLENVVRGIFSRNNRQYIRVARHLRRNPGIISKRYEEALKEIKDLFEK